MRDFEWYDPLLITDVSHQKEQDRGQNHCKFECSLESSTMGNLDDSRLAKIDGRSVLGFSLTSPDLVICVGSPDISNRRHENSPDISNQRYQDSPENTNSGSAINVSLENGIKGSEFRYSIETKSDDLSTESSFELAVPPLVREDLSEYVIRINVGSSRSLSFQEGLPFSEDRCFSGGDTIKTEDPIISDGKECPSLYQTARFGNFSYLFENLESGIYLVDLHFAEIVFTAGPPGMRTFDIYLQEQKVISSLDIYASVGANKAFVIPDLKTYVDGDKVLSIRSEGVSGSPIVCGISIRKDSSEILEDGMLLDRVGSTVMPEFKLSKDIYDNSIDGNFWRLQVEHESRAKELSEMKRVLEKLKRDNELKSRECQEAWKSLKELQNELMRKSMHVGSLAFAIEGQVKDKSRWFSSLRCLTQKAKILKMDQIKLSEEASIFKQYVTDIEGVKSIVQSTIQQHVELYEDIKCKYLKEARLTKELYNKVLDLKGNIRVFCRCRPLNAEELAGGASQVVDFESARDGELTIKSNGISKKIFKYDAVFSPEANQVDVFEDTAPLAISVLDGYNVCIFAYGQTGTGKTFTMEGTKDARGVNYRTLEKLFHIIEERKKAFRYEISVSVLEVYNEQLRDLLASDSQPGLSAKRLEIKQVGEGGHGHHVPGLTEARVNNVSEVWEALQTGSNLRAVGSTNINEHSSRSHCMHCVMVKGENLLNGECTKSKLWLIDLAGSERIAKTEVQGDRLKETQNINRSLSALGDVISALAAKSPHIPFRNSKLTHLLQDSLGGNSKTLMFVQISPNENDLTETLCSLNFASRVRGIELGPAKRQMDNTEILKVKQMAEKFRQELKSKDLQVKKLEDINHGLEVRMKDKDMKNRNLQEKIKELESQLLVERKLARQHVDSKIAEEQQEKNQQQEEHSCELVRPPLATKILGAHKAHFDNSSCSFGDNNKLPFRLTDKDECATNANLTEKENNPDIAEQLRLPKRTGRASLSTAIPKMYTAPVAPRRNSLIPLPSSFRTGKLHLPFLPLRTIIQSDEEEDTYEDEKNECLPEQTPPDSPKQHRNASKKLSSSSALRRSLQKKIHTKSPMPPHIRRVGVNVGMEKVRVSIGRTGHRMLLGTARRMAMRDALQKRSHREKERGWNIGTLGRTL
ncbi:kinesin motor family protein [Dorcoceras hygrometricum]|uniref:Kinesin motor family protein n=1 Tax=Dorcoceras hygrometricum TaxID=472368 RepID=A0A2Z7CHQ1_9LAMI|nr:kinesin motor family protein [Dorcoceras hygrometricum]